MPHAKLGTVTVISDLNQSDLYLSSSHCLSYHGNHRDELIHDIVDTFKGTDDDKDELLHRFMWTYGKMFLFSFVLQCHITTSTEWLWDAGTLLKKRTEFSRHGAWVSVWKYKHPIYKLEWLPRIQGPLSTTRTTFISITDNTMKISIENFRSWPIPKQWRRTHIRDLVTIVIIIINPFETQHIYYAGYITDVKIWNSKATALDVLYNSTGICWVYFVSYSFFVYSIP